MTEYLQPTNPMRIVTSDAAELSFTTPVFAIAISNQHDVEYLTINGQFFTPDRIKFAEVLLHGVWCRLESRKNTHI